MKTNTTTASHKKFSILPSYGSANGLSIFESSLSYQIMLLTHKNPRGSWAV